MSIFLVYKSKYRWAEDIPRMMEKHFFEVLPSLRRQQIEFLYKNLNMTMLAANKQSTRNHEQSFFNLVGESRPPEQPATELLEQSILFEDDVVSKYSSQNRMEVSNIYR